MIGGFVQLFKLIFFIPKKNDVVSHPVRACAVGMISQTTELTDNR